MSLYEHLSFSNAECTYDVQQLIVPTTSASAYSTIETYELITKEVIMQTSPDGMESFVVPLLPPNPMTEYRTMRPDDTSSKEYMFLNTICRAMQTGTIAEHQHNGTHLSSIFVSASNRTERLRFILDQMRIFVRSPVPMLPLEERKQCITSFIQSIMQDHFEDISISMIFTTQNEVTCVNMGANMIIEIDTDYKVGSMCMYHSLWNATERARVQAWMDTHPTYPYVWNESGAIVHAPSRKASYVSRSLCRRGEPSSCIPDVTVCKYGDVAHIFVLNTTGSLEEMQLRCEFVDATFMLTSDPLLDRATLFHIGERLKSTVSGICMLTLKKRAPHFYIPIPRRISPDVLSITLVPRDETYRGERQIFQLQCPFDPSSIHGSALRGTTPTHSVSHSIDNIKRWLQKCYYFIKANHVILFLDVLHSEDGVTSLPVGGTCELRKIPHSWLRNNLIPTEGLEDARIRWNKEWSEQQNKHVLLSVLCMFMGVTARTIFVLSTAAFVETLFRGHPFLHIVKKVAQEYYTNDAATASACAEYILSALDVAPDPAPSVTRVPFARDKMQECEYALLSIAQLEYMDRMLYQHPSTPSRHADLAVDIIGFYRGTHLSSRYKSLLQKLLPYLMIA
jgi:hypothetical protein